LSEILYKCKNITKKFGATVALDKVNLEIKLNEIHGLVGENGAGKSTLIKILGGIIKPDQGHILINNNKTIFKNPSESEQKGIAVVYQEFPQCENLTVAENIFLSKNPQQKTSFFYNKKRLFEPAKQALANLGVDIAPDKYLKSCSIAEQQMVAICRALQKNPKFIIFDEPTSAISQNEVEKLLEIIKSLPEQGTTVMFVSHIIEEIKEISDRISVLRNGKLIDTKANNNSSKEDIVRMMVGKNVSSRVLIDEKKTHVKNEVIMEVKNLSQNDLGLVDINFNLKKGEILGVAGIQGAGRSELAQTIFGIHKKSTGQISLDGNQVNINNPIEAIAKGIGYLPEDRNRLGLFTNLNVKENLVAAITPKISKKGMLQKNLINEISQEHIKDLNIKPPDVSALITALSGGNQQKVLLARWLAVNPRVLILDEPTRGVDVGAKAQIRKIINKLTSSGIGVILISSELPEIEELCDRTLVMNRGRLRCVLKGDEIQKDEIIKYCTSL